MTDLEGTWDAMADDYEDFTDKPESYSNAIEWPCVRSLLPGIEGKAILDVGCGTGRFSFYFGEMRPRKVTGVDISAAMLDIARRKNAGPIVEFVKCSALDLGRALEREYDVAFSSTTSHYIEDLRGAFAAVHDALTDDGCFVLSAMHPVYTASYPLTESGDWDMRYLDRTEREYLQPWTEYGKSRNGARCRSYQHTFSDYMNALFGAGFDVVDVREPEPPDAWKADDPRRYASTLNEPLYLILKCRKRR